jgi:hypothetical protein
VSGNGELCLAKWSAVLLPSIPCRGTHTSLSLLC